MDRAICLNMSKPLTAKIGHRRLTIKRLEDNSRTLPAWRTAGAADPASHASLRFSGRLPPSADKNPRRRECNYEHRLMDYNNDPTTTLDDVRSAFQEALAGMDDPKWLAKHGFATASPF